MRNTSSGTGMLCPPGQPFTLRISIFLFFLLFNFLAKAQVQWSQSGTNIYNPNSGNVGIGTSTPNAKLEVDGNLLLLPSPYQMYINPGYTFDKTKPGMRSNFGSLVLNSIDRGTIYLNRDVYSDVLIESSPDGVNDIEVAAFKANGNVGIGTTNPNAKLAVNGNIAALQITVAATLPDYVFSGDYPLISLDSVNRYIQANHHLPGVPSADSVAKAGLNLGDNQSVLLKKIEELTLYLLQQQRELEALKAENQRLAAKVEARN
jgi:hypothetical protein